MNEARAFAPATIGNISCGFDIFGMAVDSPGDYVTATRRKEPGVVMAAINPPGTNLPVEPEKNTAGYAAILLLEHAHAPFGVSLKLDKMMPLGSGMGSSGASAVAALIAVNALLDNPLPRKHLLPFAAECERLACGSPHADNVAPALLGGIVLVRAGDPPDLVSLPVPDSLHVALVHPDLIIRTEDARNILPKEIPLTTAVHQWANAAAFTASLFTNDFALMGRAMPDFVAEPFRKKLIPHFDAAREAAMKAGAVGMGISGSGPSLFALASSPDIAKLTGDAISAVYGNSGIKCQVHVSPVNKTGARLIEEGIGER